MDYTTVLAKATQTLEQRKDRSARTAAHGAGA